MEEINSIPSLAGSSALFGSYARIPQTYDELWEGDGVIRNTWLPLYDFLKQAGKQELGHRHSEIQRLLKENGVTYNVYGDPAGLYRPWKLDAIPTIIGEEEWNFIESALIQRAELLNLILSDIYGKRELIKNGNLPLDLIYNHNGFLRACDGVKLPGKHQLFFYAVDIGRDKDGKLWVLNDRTQAPSGSGYTLENRFIMSKVMPELSGLYSIRKLTGFFDTLHQSLISLAPKDVQNPKVVILTPGPNNETYFEHAYLSAYLGYDLVQGDDLTVREGYVWIKTIHGLDRVDIILRRVDDSFCDPLELNPESQLGVTGLLEVVRRGNVVVANPLGSSILENRGLSAFLPGLCRQYLNEDLKMPSVNSWWCGQEAEKNYVLQNLEKLRIKTIHSEGRTILTSVNSSIADNLNGLKEKILTKPYLYSALEKLNVSTSPSFVEGNLDRRFAILRCFIVATEDGYKVMPGGMGRSSAERDSFKISNQSGGISKDTWVLGKEPETNSLPVILPFTSSSNSNNVLSSRTAENMFWTGRYATRARITARVMMETLIRLSEVKSSDTADQKSVNTLLASLSNLMMVYPSISRYNPQSRIEQVEQEILSLILSTKSGSSLASTLGYLKRAIFAVRNQWPEDTWHIIDEIENSLTSLKNIPVKNGLNVQHCLKNVYNSLFNFIGLFSGSLLRDDAFFLLNAGRRIEKALLLISQIKTSFEVKQDELVEYSLMSSLLSSNMSLVIYRSRFRSFLLLEAFLDLMIFDSKNPSSIIHQIEKLKYDLSELSVNKSNSRPGKEERLLLEIYTEIIKNDPASLLGAIRHENMKRVGLDNFLTKISSLLENLSDTLVSEYFSHSESSWSLYNRKEDN